MSCPERRERVVRTQRDEEEQEGQGHRTVITDEL